MDTATSLLANATQRLALISDTPRLDAELLLSHALGISRAKLLGRLHDTVDAAEFLGCVERRLNHEPIAYITGTWEFFSLEFIVRAPVLVPRPETEHLVEAALEFLKGRAAPRVLDLCTGTGCVAISIAKNAPGAIVDAVDIQPHAVALARENAARLGAAVTIYEGDLFHTIPAENAPYDVIVSNPPYIADDEYAELPLVIQKHEDRVALLAGDDGLDIVRRILRDAPARLNENGLLAVEIGDTQAELVQQFAESQGWREATFVRDLAGHERVLLARRP